MQFPVARGDIAFLKFIFYSRGLVVFVHRYEYAFLRVRIDFAKSVIAAAARPVSLLFGAKRHWANKPELVDRAIAAKFALISYCLNIIF